MDAICETRRMSLAGRPLRVLLADDHPLFLNALRVALAAEEWIDDQE